MRYLLLILLFPLFSQAQQSPGVLNLINIVRPIGAGNVSVSPSSLVTYYAKSGIASPIQTVYVTFSGLSGNIGSISIPSGFEAAINGGGTYATSYTGLNNGLDSFQVRVAASTGVSTPSGSVTASVTGGNSASSTAAAVVTSNAPSIVLSPTTTNLPSTTAGSQGSSASFTVTIRNATGTSYTVASPNGNILISANNSSFATTVTGSVVGGGASFTIYGALSSTATANTYTNYVTVATSGITTVQDTLTGTVNSSGGTATMFAFSRTSRPLPSISGVTIVPIVGDPSVSVLTGSGNGISISTGSTGGSGAWQAYVSGSISISSGDTTGSLGSTLGSVPDSLLYRNFLTYSSSGNRLADSVHQTLSKPNFIITGLTVGHTYTVEMAGSMNTRYSFQAAVAYRAIGNATYISSIINQENNKGNDWVQSMVPDNTGTIKVYLFTDPSPQNLNSISVIKITP